MLMAASFFSDIIKGKCIMFRRNYLPFAPKILGKLLH